MERRDTLQTILQFIYEYEFGCWAELQTLLPNPDGLVDVGMT